MTNVTLPREVVEQLVRMLDACLDDAIQVQCDLEQGYTKSIAGAQAKQVELSKEALNAGRAALASAEQSKIWVLTEEYNDYDQHGGYFVQAWVGKPTAEQLKTFAATVKENWSDEYVTHLLAGGGRKKVEYHWYLLEEQP